MTIFAALLDSDIIIQRNTLTGTSDSNMPIYSWSILATVKGRIEPAGGQERIGPDEAIIATHRIFLLPTDVTEKDRLLADGIYYDILKVNRLRAFNSEHHYELEAKEVLP